MANRRTVRSTRILLVAASLTLALGLWSLRALADPSGSYTKSCKDCLDNDGELICQCSYKGAFKGTSIFYGLCVDGSIWNDKQTLRCTIKHSFKNSCSNIYWNSSRITSASCKKKNGKTSSTSYENWKGCEGDIANCDGTLTCGSCP
jgi:hypothetical protein